MTVCILYSGGFDSTHTTIHYLEKGENIDLLTFNNGAISFIEQVDNSINRFYGLNEKSSIKYKKTSIMHLLQTIVFDDLENDILEDKKSLICVGCKLCMTAEAIIYCKKNNINTIADGYRKTQSEHPEQREIFINAVDKFTYLYGIKYEHPIYDIEDDRILRIKGYKHMIPSTSLKTHCVIHSISNKNIKDKTILNYIQRKLPKLEEYIKKEINNII